MRGIILKDLYEGFCIKKNLINWLASMIFTSALTAISEFMRGAYGFLLIVVLLFPVMGSTLLQMTVEQDEKAEFDRIQLTYPLSKSEIVLSKYLGGLIVQGGMTLYSFVFVLIYVYGYRTITFGRRTSDMGNRCSRRCDLLCSELM
ncbi:MAG: ABC-2 transporter permease [Mediterraneibacter gnavus]